MITSNKTFRQGAVFLSVFFFSMHVAIARPSGQKTSVERDFDTIREFQSYDPATDRWSKIEDFKGVDILKDRQERHEESYLYHNFWAYDPIKGRWNKVDIRSYGYERAPKAEEPVVEVKKKRAPKKAPSRSYFGFLRHWAWGATIGGGGEFAWLGMNKFGLRKDNEELLFKSTETHEGKTLVYELDPSTLLLSGKDLSLDEDLVNSSEEVTDFIYKSFALIPISGFTHYTLFDRLRVGLGGKFELQRFSINDLSSNHVINNENSQPNPSQWIHNPAWFGILGFNLISQPRYNFAIDFKAGQRFRIGPLQEVFKTKETEAPIETFSAAWEALLGEGIVSKVLDEATLFGVGISYEEKISDYWKFIFQLGGDWSVTHAPIVSKESDEGASEENLEAKEKLRNAGFAIYRNNVAIAASLGFQFNLGKEPTLGQSVKKNRARRVRRK